LDPGPGQRPDTGPDPRLDPSPGQRVDPGPPAARRPEPAPPGETREARPATASQAREAREAWLRDGQLQFDYLVGQGLQPGDRMLEIGCGSLSAGHLFIDYLSTGNYYGIDISPDKLIAAQRIITEFGLQAKLPHLTLVAPFDLKFLPASRFTVIHAHNVLDRAPVEAIGAYLAQVRRVMTTDAIFDFTFGRADGAGHQAQRADPYYHADTLIGLAGSRGLDAELMKDWDELGHPDSKLRLTRRS
jgi:SAM-dependent methyltransferase